MRLRPEPVEGWRGSRHVKMENMRRILHIDMDAFFSSVEQKRRPELIGKPVVIGGDGDPTKRGVVSTAVLRSPKVRNPFRHAPQNRPPSLPGRYLFPLTTRSLGDSRKLKTVLREITPIMEDVGIDEAFLDVSSVERPSDEIALEIKERSGRKPASTAPSVSRRTGFSQRSPLTWREPTA